jgi:hypothetical protein
MSPKQEQPAPSKKANTLTLVGGAILLLSFTTQNFLYDRWHSQKTDLETAMLDRGLIEKSVLLNEVLYFVSSVPDTEMTARVREAYISDAARKQAIAAGIPVMLSEAVTTQQKIDLANSLYSRARDVHDFDSFRANVQFINSKYDEYFKELNANYSSRNRMTGYARWVYLLLYLLGSLITLIGVRQEVPS